jgi:hypothetical protein
MTAAKRAGGRAEILAAAESCFARLGIRHATMRDVIAGSGLRSVVDRLLYVACVMLEKRTLFDPSRAQKKNAAA